MSDAINNAQSHYETIGALWEAADFLTNYRDDPEAFGDLSSEAREVLADACGVNAFDDLARSDSEALEEYARESVLSVDVRSDWEPIGSELVAAEFQLLLSTGGPACRIVGEIRDGEPCRSEIQYQDWGTPWTRLAGQQCDALDWFASLFYFGG